MRRGLTLNTHNTALSLRLKPEIWMAVSAAMEQKGYNLKQRSRWVSEAMESLMFNDWQGWTAAAIVEDLMLYQPAVANIPPVRVKVTPASSRQLKLLGQALAGEGFEFDDFRTRVTFVAIHKALKKQGINYRNFEVSNAVSTVETPKGRATNNP